MPENLPVVNPVVLERGLRAELYAAYQAGEAFWPRLAMRVPSTGPDETYGWMGSPPAMREWLDERVPQGLIDHKFTIVNRDWEASLAVSRNALEDDRTGQIAARIRELGERAKRHPDELVSQLLADGGTALCYDGRPFFDTAHVEGAGGSQSNALTASAADPDACSADEFAAAFRLARRALRTFKDDRGKPFNHSLPGLAVMVPVGMESSAEQTLRAEVISGSANPLAGAAELMVNPLLTAADRFYVFVAGNALRPFIFQERRGITAASLRADSEDGFYRKHWVFGVDARYNAGYGLWQYAVRVTFQ
jgi:phage major head subunit gpT-like protein